MDPILLGSIWWVAPVLIGAGAASYGALTSGKRRARRIELDAARHEESRDYRTLVAARAQVKAAHADVLAARSRARASLMGTVLPTDPATVDAVGRLQYAKQTEKSASLALRATRTRIKAAEAEYRASSSRDPLPAERLTAEHDAIATRFIAYETDAGLVMKYPQMTDPRHPSTLAFLEALREAGRYRPAPGVRIGPAQYAEYRQAVRRLAVAFDEAERAAGAAAPTQPVVGVWSIPEWLNVSSLAGWFGVPGRPGADERTGR